MEDCGIDEDHRHEDVVHQHRHAAFEKAALLRRDVDLFVQRPGQKRQAIKRSDE
jgi:hypothetical protein